MIRPPAAVQRICDRCPVQGNCLSHALINHERGVWGGTSEAQRKEIRKSRHRVKCLRCNGRTIVQAARHSICLSCGLSWSTPGGSPTR